MPTFGYFHAHYLFSSALILAMSSFVPVGNPNDMSCFDSALDLLRSMSENGNLAAAEFYHNLEQVKICLDAYRGTPTRLRRNDVANDTSGTGINTGISTEKTTTELKLPNASSSMIGSSHNVSNLPGTFPGPSAMPPIINSLSQPHTDILSPRPVGAAPGRGPGTSTENEHLLSGSLLAPPPPPAASNTEPYTFPARETISGYTTQMAFLEPTMQDFLAQSDIDLGLMHPVDTFLTEAENLYTSHEF